MAIGGSARRSAPKGRVGTATDDARYQRFYPYHAEVCALTEIRKKPGFGAKLHSGIGGHSVLYLNGVRLDRRARYPVLRLCDPEASPESHGVGISVNSHFSNANWIAVEGRDFVWRGALEPGERLTRAAYERTQDHAKAMGVLDGVTFHDHLFRDKPLGMSKRDYMYEISIATDYAMNFGRDIYRARIPLDHARMATIVAFLNGLNAPYRDGSRIYRWRVLNDNCSHVTHNALASAGIWAPWPTGQFFVVAALKFPVPKNEFVDLMLRTNDLPIQDAQAVYDDSVARRAFLEKGALPTAPGALGTAEPAIGDNDLYHTDRLRLIFYDNPFWGPYRSRLARILGEPRYFDLRANLHHFAAVYGEALERRREARGTMALPSGANTKALDERARFDMRYDRYIDREAAKVSRYLASLNHPNEAGTEAVP